MNVADPIRDLFDIDRIKNYLKEWNEKYYILFLVGINSGLRISDLRKLKVIDFMEASVHRLSEQKTGKKRKLYINKNILREVLGYIDKKGLVPDDYVVQSNKGNNQPISRQRMYDVCSQTAEALNLKSKMIFSPHSFRKTWGYHTYLRTKDIALIMTVLNHSSPSVSLRYIGMSEDIIEDKLKDIEL